MAAVSSSLKSKTIVNDKMERLDEPFPEEFIKSILKILALIGIPSLIVMVASFRMMSLTCDNDYPFTFQVDFAVAKAKASPSVSNYFCSNAMCCDPSLESELGLDLNVTLSITNSEPIVFDSLLSLLSYDNDKSVLMSNMVDGFFQRSPSQMQLEFADVQVFPKKEDEFGLEFTGHYWSLAENIQSEKCHLKIACRGIKIVLHSSSSDHNFTIGRMLGGPLLCK